MMTDEFMSCVPNAIRYEQMQVIRNLIEVKISDQQLAAANFTDGIEVQVRCEKPFTLNAFWIVKMQDLFREMEKDWPTMRDLLWYNTFLDNGQSDKSNDKQKHNFKCLMKNEPQIHQESNEQVVCRIKPPKPIDTSNMRTTPRDFYPLVIIVSCHEEEPNPNAHDAASNIHIVHIKDEVVPVKSHIIKQYIKQIDGRILDISPVYLEETATCFICFEEANPDERLQLLCLLPCRHSPICSNCIARIRECPKCRCPIASVFDINAPNASTVTEQEARAAATRPHQTIDPSLRHLYDDANEPNEPNDRTNRRNHGFLSSIKSMFGL